MKESAVEAKLVRGVKDIGGLAFKFVSPGNVGVPDRILIFPNGTIWFVELKADGGRLSAMQKRQIAKLEKAGVLVTVLTGPDEVTQFLQERAEEQRRARSFEKINERSEVRAEVAKDKALERDVDAGIPITVMGHEI